MPRLLEYIAATAAPLVALERVLDVVSAVLRRSAYIALLLENPPAAKRLVEPFSPVHVYEACCLPSLE